MPTSRKQKENDPTVGRIKRLSSIASIASPIGQIASKFRRPSTSLLSSMSGDTEMGPKKASFIARGGRQGSNTSSKSQLNTPPATPILPDKLGHARQDNASKIPKSKTTSNLPISVYRNPSNKPLAGSQSSTNLMKKSRIPTPVGMRSSTSSHQSRQAIDFLALRKISGSALPRFNTQPNLVSSTVNRSHPPELKESLTHVSKHREAKRTPSAVPRHYFATPLGRNLYTTFESAYEQGSEVWQTHTAIRWPGSQEKTPSRPAVGSRKSIEEEYEELHLSPKGAVSKTIGSTFSPRRSLGGDIKHHQLMMPLSPPLPRLPAGYIDVRNPTTSSACSVRQVTQSQPPAYWSGRYTSLNDRLLNEAIDACPTSSDPLLSERSSKEEEELARLAGAAHGAAHAQRILDLLYAACMTEEALRSLRSWQTTFAHLRQMPALGTYMPKVSSSKDAAQAPDKRRESVVLRSLSGNAPGVLTSSMYNARRSDSEVNEGPVLRRETARVTVMSNQNVESLSDTRSARKTSFIDRLLSSGRKGVGKASVLGGAAMNSSFNGRD